MRVLYVSYDGALDPLGQALVVPTVTALARLGHNMSLVTFEKVGLDTPAGRALAADFLNAGVDWIPLRYTRRPKFVSTAWDLLKGFGVAAIMTARAHPDLVHARSYPPTLLAALLNRLCGARYIFDMRGLYADERVDGGLWAAGGAAYRATKRLERWFLRRAAAVVTLTEASRPVVREMMTKAGTSAELVVIPTSVDLAIFRPTARQVQPSTPTLAYFGSLGTWYLLDAMVKFGAAFLGAVGEGRLLFLVNGDEQERIRQALEALSLGELPVEVYSVQHREVPQFLASVTATMCFVRNAPSKVASAATKVSESLALGIPVAVSRGVGDAEEIITQHRVGVVVDADSDSDMVRAAHQLIEIAGAPDTAEKCRQVAHQFYSLDKAVDAYDALYRRVSP